MNRQYDHVKLHVTMINSLFRDNNPDVPGNSERQTNTQKTRQTFDARQILKKYAQYDFGKQRLKDIHLSRRYTTGRDGFYDPTSVVKILN